jgi:hypothetical protein
MAAMNLRMAFLLLAMPALALAQGKITKPDEPGTQWSVAKAWTWYQKTGAIRGCNYLPRTAVNSTEMWQAETFDPKTIDQELGWAEGLGYNSVRVFLQYIVWKQDPKAFKKRLEQFLAIADRHGIRVMPVLFDDCAFAGRDPYPGKQDEPVPGVHNSGWVPSPGLAMVTNSATWPDPEKYVRDVVKSLAKDSRVLLWDLYNEPGNSNLGEQSLPLVEATFGWARAAHPSQPLTVAPWDNIHSPMSKKLFALCDVVSFHGYDDVSGMKDKIGVCRATGRPVICSEWLRRQAGNTFAEMLPLFALNDVGWYNWGLVAGRTQTYMPWGSKKGDAMPALWQHDVLRADGQPFDPKEAELLRAQRRQVGW